MNPQERVRGRPPQRTAPETGPTDPQSAYAGLTLLTVDPEQTADPVRQAFDNADDWWRDCALRGLKWLAELGQPFTAWDLVQLGVPEPDDHHRWGGLFRVARQQGLITPVGYAPSRRPTAGGSITRVWRGVPRDDLDEAG